MKSKTFRFCSFFFLFILNILSSPLGRPLSPRGPWEARRECPGGTRGLHRRAVYLLILRVTIGRRSPGKGHRRSVHSIPPPPHPHPLLRPSLPRPVLFDRLALIYNIVTDSVLISRTIGCYRK